MARQNMRTNPASKHLHVYQDFSGGLNTMDAIEKIMDNELADLWNVDIGQRGSLVRRHGMVKHIEAPVSGKGQGYFRYFREGGSYDEIIAVNGNLYRNGNLLPIVGLASFQNERNIEAVQFRDKLYIATGTKLVQYDGENAQVVEPYRPQPLEALYIGTNGLADNPNDFMDNGEATHLRIDGVTFNQRYGIINQPITLTCYVSKPSGQQIEYKFEKRTTYQREGFWELGRDYSTDPSYTFETDFEGDIQFRVWAKPVGQDEFHAKQYLIPKYKVKPVPDPNDLDVPVDTIHSCTNILLHWNRLIMYGDINQPDAIFVSHLNNPAYFPVPNSLVFESTERERITKIVKFRDQLVVFTPNTIQALFGKSPMDYQRVTMNSSMGSIASESVKVVGNYIMFLSKEGIHILKSLGYTENKANVEKIDSKIDNLILKETSACAVVQDNQYQITYPEHGIRFRCYYEQGFAWTKDKSNALDFSKMYEIDGDLYGQSISSGNVYKFDRSTHVDDGFVFETLIETKYFDFGEPYHDKKLKEIHLIMANQNRISKISTFIYADASQIMGTDTSHPVVDEEGNVGWYYENEPNFEIYSGTMLGEWVMGKSPFGEIHSERYKLRLSGRCRKTRIILSHTDDSPIQLLGLGWIFKTKRP